MIEAETVKT